MKKWIAVCMTIIVFLTCGMIPVRAEANSETGQEPEIEAPSAILMEASTGKVIYEKDADTKRPPASVTKVMTLLLIYEALENGTITKEDVVTTSEYASSMGGSQVFLETGEEQTVDTLLKCIVVSSANDACVAMAEYISGSEEAFVEAMNKKAKELGMNNTVFKNCNGLDTDGHMTTARDIALMSRELTTHYPDIFSYTKIWMDTIIHKTKRGEEEFGLSNTNKLIRQYPYATGLKTGSTGNAKFCLSATASKDGIDLIAVVMAAPDSKTRIADTETLLNYGFSKCRKYEDDDYASLQKKATVQRGKKDTVTAVQKNGFMYIDTEGKALDKIEKEIKIEKTVKAPVKKGQKIGEVIYKIGEEQLGTVPLVASESVPKQTLKDAMEEVLGSFSL